MAPSSTWAPVEPEMSASPSSRRPSLRSDDSRAPKVIARSRPSYLEAANMFADAEMLKEQVHNDFKNGEYEVTDLYKSEGLAQTVARSSLFGNMTLGVIFMNSLWIGLEMDLNEKASLSEAAWYFQLGEYFFCVFFSFEWGARFFAFRNKRDGFHDKWFCFDTFLVALMVAETFILPNLLAVGASGGQDLSKLSMLRIFRLLRLTRMVRFMRSVPELVTLLRSMTIAMRSVLSTLGLLLIFTYIFSIVFKSQLKVSAEKPYLKERFGRIPSAMWTLMLSGTLLDAVTVCATKLREASVLLALVFFVFVFISSFTVLNMLIGLLCDVVTAVAAAEKEKVMVTFVRSKLTSVLERLDSDGNGTISKAEFNELVTIPEAVQALNELGVDIANLVSLSDHLFEKQDGPQTGRQVDAAKDDESEDTSDEGRVLTFADFLEMVIRLRPDNRPSVLDIVDLRKLVQLSHRQVVSRIEPIEKMNDKLICDMHSISDQLDIFCQKHRKLIIGARRGRRFQRSTTSVQSNSVHVAQRSTRQKDFFVSGSPAENCATTSASLYASGPLLIASAKSHQSLPGASLVQSQLPTMERLLNLACDRRPCDDEPQLSEFRDVCSFGRTRSHSILSEDVGGLLSQPRSDEAEMCPGGDFALTFTSASAGGGFVLDASSADTYLDE